MRKTRCRDEMHPAENSFLLPYETTVEPRPRQNPSKLLVTTPISCSNFSLVPPPPPWPKRAATFAITAAFAATSIPSTSSSRGTHVKGSPRITRISTNKIFRGPLNAHLREASPITHNPLAFVTIRKIRGTPLQNFNFRLRCPNAAPSSLQRHDHALREGPNVTE
jgi:hypothetical protein